MHSVAKRHLQCWNTNGAHLRTEILGGAVDGAIDVTLFYRGAYRRVLYQHLVDRTLWGYGDFDGNLRVGLVDGVSPDT